MAASIPGVFEEDLSSSILKSKVFVIGAGGIGCELLKNLVLSGFKDISIIDMDTIDVSNLNRQFLFHKQHVGKSKAMVARESVLKFSPGCNITAYHDSITSTDYGVNFFKTFDVVMNALDNRAARNHVNRMCLAADVPLIESGTEGYAGQVELIKKGLTQCYECQPKAPQKTYPGCTIRNTPSEPIHCIVWAKHLFNQLFGEADGDEDVSPDSADPEAIGQAGTDAMVKKANDKGNVERVSTRAWAQACQYDPEKLFTKLFHDDIKYLLSMSKLWETRRPPVPLTWKDLPDAVPGSSRLEVVGLKDQRIWSMAECATIFASCCMDLKGKLEKLDDDDFLVWDKDDKHAMDFVCACANIRSCIFGITQKSRFDVKSMAGNIIPAIATTNAIIAGLVVLHAFKVLQGKFEQCQSIYLRFRPNHRNQQIVPEKFLNPPKPKCTVCSAKPEVGVILDVNFMTVKELEEQVLKKSLNMVAPDVMYGLGKVLISSEEGETEENNNKTLREMGIVDGCILKVDDFLQNYELSITISHKPLEKEKPEFEIIADLDQLKPKAEEEKKEEPAASTANGTTEEDKDDIEMVDEDTSEAEAKKRKLNDHTGEGSASASKKRKVNGSKESDDGIIEIN